MGFEAFIKGYISPKWAEVQHLYHSKEIRDTKYNLEKWKLMFVRMIIDRGNSLWEERCNIIHTANLDTDEKRYREFLFDLIVSTRDKKEINPKDYHILRRKRIFFLRHLNKRWKCGISDFSV